MQNDSDVGVASPSSGLPKEESNTSLVGATIDDAEEFPRPPPSSPMKPVPVDPGCPPLSSFPSPAPSPSPPLGRRRGKSDVSDVSMDGFQHRRGVSWDNKSVAEAIEATKRVSDAAPPKKHIMTFSDLNGVSPIEAEAETMIFKALEEKIDQPQSVHNILAGVPDEVVPVFEEVPEEVEIRQSGLSRFQRAANQVRDANAGTKNAFAEVVSAMRLLHESSSRVHDSQSRQSTDKPFDSELLPPTEKEIPATSNADALIQNANILFRRSSTSRGPMLSISEEDKDKVDTSDDVELGDSGLMSQDHNGKSKRRIKSLKMRSMMKHARSGLHREFNLVKNDFIEPNKSDLRVYIKVIMGAVILPLVIVASVLYYLVDNPDLGKEGATISWFLLFLVRHVVTFTLAKTSEIFVIDYLSLKKRFTVKVFGPAFALFVVQSKGYPCVIFFWAVYGLMMLSGKHRFAKHWLFYQPYIDMCNANNNAGTITNSSMNFRILGSAIIFGVAVALKRLWLGLALGKRTYNNYGTKLTKIMHNILRVSEVATLSQRGHPERKLREYSERSADLNINMDFGVSDSVASQQEVSPNETPGAEQFYGSFNMSQQQLINDHLGAWEEPEIIKKKPDDASITAILHFRQALTFVDNTYPFSHAFGPANNRNVCIESGQKVYERLLLRSSPKEGEVLHFNAIAELAIDRDGSLNSDKVKELVRIFRPDREGILTMIDFLKSVDNVYKEFRLIQASIENSGSVDRAFEIMVNYAFFTILWCVLLFICGIDPFALFLSLSAFVVGFAFMIGGASSKYFEGILFILVRRPYDIGDRIHISNPEKDTIDNGSLTWFVEDLGLYSTTVRFAATNEVATYSNGSLASSRIINAARSPLACVTVSMKFGVDVSYEKVQIFKTTVEHFVKDRPREWVSLVAFRAGGVEQDLGYIKYSIGLQHRESWQNIGAILNSKAEVTSFSLEVAKQLGCRYTAPPLPVNLSMNGVQTINRDAEGDNQEDAGTGDDFISSEMGAIASMFKQMK